MWEPVDARGEHGLHRRGHLQASRLGREAIGAALADEHPGLDEGAHELLEEERVAAAPLDQELAERPERAVAPDQRVEQLARGRRREGLDRELREAGLARPVVLVLGTVVHEQQEPRGVHAPEERVEEGLGLGVDPLEVLEHQQQRLVVGLLEDEPRERAERFVPPLVRLERPERVGVRQRVEQREDRGQRGLELAPEREHGVRHPGADRVRGVALVDAEVPAQDVDDRLPRAGLVVGQRAGLEDLPLARERRGDELVDQPRLAHARLGRERRDPAVPLARVGEHPVQALELRVAPDEAAPALGGGAAEGARGRGADQLVDLERRVEPLDGAGSQRARAHRVAREPERVRRDEHGTGVGHLLHPRREVGRLADSGVIHVEVAADRAHDDLAGVEADAEPERHAARALDLLRPAAERLLHAERRVAGARRVVLVRERRAEERHDPVAHDLVDGALVAVHRLHHPLEHAVEQLARLLRVAVGEQLHRALEVGEEDGHLLALALERALRREDLLGEVAGRVRAWARARAGCLEPRAAVVAKPGARGVVVLAAGALHEAASLPPARARPQPGTPARGAGLTGQADPRRRGRREEARR